MTQLIDGFDPKAAIIDEITRHLTSSKSRKIGLEEATAVTSAFGLRLSLVIEKITEAKGIGETLNQTIVTRWATQDRMMDEYRRLSLKKPAQVKDED